jgi:hypothetical protein
MPWLFSEVAVSPELATQKMIVLSALSAALSIAWGILLAFDVAVFALTIYKATKVGYKAPLIQILVRDGERIPITHINEWLIPFPRIPVLHVRFCASRDLIDIVDRSLRPQRTLLRQFGQYFDPTSMGLLPRGANLYTTNSASTLQYAPVRFFVNSAAPGLSYSEL